MDAGVEFVEDPKDYGSVWIETLKDPEGNLLQLLQSDHTHATSGQGDRQERK